MRRSHSRISGRDVAFIRPPDLRTASRTEEFVCKELSAVIASYGSIEARAREIHDSSGGPLLKTKVGEQRTWRRECVLKGMRTAFRHVVHGSSRSIIFDHRRRCRRSDQITRFSEFRYRPARYKGRSASITIR
jgi:hypothetical protein